MYRADFVKLHYVHYATATVVSQMTEEETKAAGLKWRHKYKEGARGVLLFHVRLLKNNPILTTLHSGDIQ